MFKKILTLYSANIETDKICEAKNGKEILSSQNLFRSSRERRVSVTGKKICNYLTEITSSAGSECLQLYLKNFCLVAPHISKKETKLRQPISPSERLCVTLRYLVTGDAFVTIGASYRMSPSTISQIIPETCNALWKVLLDNNYIDVPKTEKRWHETADGFYKS